MKKEIKVLMAMLTVLFSMTATLSAQAGQKFNINGLQMEFVSCTPYADGVVMNFTFTNTAGREMAFKVSNYFEDQCFVVDEDGDQHQLTELIIGGQGAAGSDFRPIPQDITMKGQIYFRHISERHTMIKRMKLLCKVAKDGAGEKEQNVVMADIPITPSNNTNMEGTRFTDPIVTMNTKGATRWGKNVELLFTLTNTGKDRYDAPVREVTAYGEDGNAYDAESSIKYMRLETDMPQKFSIVIKNVPKSVKKFSLIRAMFDEWGHKMEWRNVIVEEGPYTTTEKNTRCKLMSVEYSNTATMLHLEYTAGEDGYMWLSKSGYIVGNDGKKLALRDAEGIALSPQRTSIKANKTYKMTLTFPALAPSVSHFDFIESEDSDWKFFGIKVER